MEWKYNLRPYNTQCSHQRLVFILVSSVYPKTEMLLQSTERLQPRDIRGLEENKSIDDFMRFKTAAFLHCYSDKLLGQPFSRLTSLEDCGGRRAEKQRFLLLPIISCTYWGELSQPMSEMNRTARKLLREPTLIPRRSFHLLQFRRIQGELHTISQFQTCTNITSRMLFKSFKFMGSFCLFVSQ